MLRWKPFRDDALQRALAGCGLVQRLQGEFRRGCIDGAPDLIPFLGEASLSRNAEHRQCFKYTQRDLHQCDNDCCAWLLAWAKLGMQNPNKEDHESVHPSEEQLAEARATL